MKKIFTLCFLALGTWTTAQVDRSVMPAPTQAKKINIKDSEVFTTANGITVILSENQLSTVLKTFDRKYLNLK